MLRARLIRSLSFLERLGGIIKKKKNKKKRKKAIELETFPY
jgi:hypothetical protein